MPSPTPREIAIEIAAALDGDELAALRLIVRSLATHIAATVSVGPHTTAAARAEVDAASTRIARAALNYLDDSTPFFDLLNTVH